MIRPRRNRIFLSDSGDNLMPRMSFEQLPYVVRRNIEHFTNTESERQVEVDAYGKLIELIEREYDEFTKCVYRQALDYIIELPMRLSYVREQTSYFEDALKRQKAARDALQPFELFEAIERVVCGATTAFAEDRPSRTTLHADAEFQKTQEIRPASAQYSGAVLPDNFRGSYYKFGSHKYFIGRAIEESVRMIEKRYGINFKDMEIKRRSKGTTE